MASQPEAIGRPALGRFDVVSLMLGIMIGAGIYETPSVVCQNVAGPWSALAVWVMGGLLSLSGALCFAELAAAYPQSGGEYVYLTRAYGRGVGFLFAWAQLTVIRTGGGIAAMAFVFADHAATLRQLTSLGSIELAAASIAGLSAINLLGLHPGRLCQNLLTALKVLALVGIAVAGFLADGAAAAATSPGPVAGSSLALAVLFVLYTYDGWNEAVYVTADVHDCRRTLPQSLILGTALVTLIYLIVNIACLAGLGFDGLRATSTPTADLLGLVLGAHGRQATSVIVMISALGAMNATIFTGSRLWSAFGADHPLFAHLARLNQHGMPVMAFLMQATVSIAMVGVVGLWSGGRESFKAIVTGTAPVFWVFFLMTGLAILVLRVRDSARPRVFRVPGYPVVPLIFCAWSGLMLVGSVVVAWQQATLGLGLLFLGLPVYWLSETWWRQEADGKCQPAPTDEPASQRATWAPGGNLTPPRRETPA
jgi:amino acid transporter